MMTVSGLTTVTKPQQHYEIDPDPIKDKEDLDEFGKLLSIEKLKLLGKKIHAGGVGSGRHVEYGNFKHIGTNKHKEGGTKYYVSKSTVVKHRSIPAGDKVKEILPNKVTTYKGDPAGAIKHLKEYYGIS